MTNSASATLGNDQLPAQRGGAKALLLTVLGEFVLPAGGSVWTSTLVQAADALGIGEKNSRQATARIADSGLLSGTKHGRSVRWSLTDAGRELLESGTRRIYGFGRGATTWDRRWLVAHCPAAGTPRSERNELRKRLGFLGFGELEANLLISPHSEREPALRSALADAGLAETSTVLFSTTADHRDDVDLVERAWCLDHIAESYRSFMTEARSASPNEGAASFRAVVELVHAWRRFPFSDPELPAELLPPDWPGPSAVETFHSCHQRWSPVATEWFADHEHAAS